LGSSTTKPPKGGFVDILNINVTISDRRSDYMSTRVYKCPVYLLRMGGLVKKTAEGKFVFVHPPSGFEFKIGDEVPYKSWTNDLLPYNGPAQREMKKQKPKKNCGLSELLDQIEELNARSAMTQWSASA
jgi:hypothetical protein